MDIQYDKKNIITKCKTKLKNKLLIINVFVK